MISLFSGIGGFELAAQWMGWEVRVSCEINDFGRRILSYYWPQAYHHDDIKTLTYEKIREAFPDIGKFCPVILVGGFPCQPFSHAGKRKGTQDSRYMWPDMLRLIRESRPDWVVGENVYGIVSWDGGMVFEQVCSDLEGEGYSVWPVALPAASVNAPHKRDRVWFVAHANEHNDGRNTGENEGEGSKERLSKRDEIRKSIEPGEIFGTTANPYSWKCEERGNINGKRKNETKNTTGLDDRPPRSCEYGNVADPDNEGFQGGADFRIAGESGTLTKQQPSGFIRPDWENFPTQSPVCGGDDGIPESLDGITVPKWRKESIKAYGNAIVPQVFFQICKTIALYESLNK